MRNNENAVWLYVGAGIIVASVGLFVAMGGTWDDVEDFVQNPSAGLARAGDAVGRGFDSAGATINSTTGHAFESPTKGVASGIGALGGGISGAMRGMAQ